MMGMILKTLSRFVVKTPEKAVQETLDLLMDSRTWPIEKLQELQWEKLKRLLKHAYDTCPFHRARFDQIGLHPVQDFRSLDCLSKLPVLSKDDLRSSLEELKTRDANVTGIELNSTGGSTGVPLNFYQDDNYRTWADAMRIRTWRRIPGIDPNAIEALMWGAVRDIGKGLKPFSTLKSLLRYRTLALNTFDLDEPTIRQYLSYYNRVKPEILRGYASSLFFVAEFIEKKEIKVHAPKIILSSAEVLKPLMREKISTVFNAEILDSYGCREVSHIAGECQEHNGLHLAMENQIVELVENKILVTNLNNFALPMLRYQVGDMADSITKSTCRCGQHSWRLNKLLGRENENIQLPNGKTINGEFFEFLFFGLKTVERFQVVYSKKQEQLRVRLKVSDSSESAGEMVKQKMRDNFNFENVHVEYAGQFDQSPTGKFRFVYQVEDFE